MLLKEDQRTDHEAQSSGASNGMALEDSHTFVATVAKHLPPFWPVNPRIWFVQVEAQSSRRGITLSRMKYEEVVCALSMEYATEIQDFLLDPPEDHLYEKFKEQLILRIAAWESQKLRQLLTTEELGVRKPSRLL